MSTGSINVSPTAGSIGSLLINNDSESSSPLTVAGDIRINPAATTTGNQVNIDTVNIQRLTSAQTLAITAELNSAINGVIINSPDTCFSARIATTVNVHVSHSSARIDSVAMYVTHLKAGMTVTANGVRDDSLYMLDVLISAENAHANCRALEVTGNIAVSANAGSIDTFHAQGLSVVRGSVTATANMGSITSFELTPRDGPADAVTINGGLSVQTLSSGTGGFSSVQIGRLATVDGVFLAKALGGPISEVEVKGSATGAEFNAAFTLHSEGGTVNFDIDKLRCVCVCVPCPLSV